MIAKNTNEDVTRFGPKLLWETICERHPDQWVVLADTDASEAHEVTAGRVVWHGADYAEAHRQTKPLELRHVAVLYTGRIPSDVRFVL